jgi:hypothetical protein
MEKGLYKYDGELMFAELMVSYPNGTTLTVADYECTDGEVYDGWYWFDSRDEAKTALGVSEQVLSEMFNTPTR